MELDRVIGTSIRHAIRLPKTFPTALIQGPIRYGGLELSSNYAKQGAAKVELFLDHTRQNDKI